MIFCAITAPVHVQALCDLGRHHSSCVLGHLHCLIQLLSSLPWGAGMAASALLAETVYSIGANVIIDSAVRAITAWDIITSLMKAWVFGVIISVVRLVTSSAPGNGGRKGWPGSICSLAGPADPATTAC